MKCKIERLKLQYFVRPGVDYIENQCAKQLPDCSYTQVLFLHCACRFCLYSQVLFLHPGTGYWFLHQATTHMQVLFLHLGTIPTLTVPSPNNCTHTQVLWLQPGNVLTPRYCYYSKILFLHPGFVLLSGPVPSTRYRSYAQVLLLHLVTVITTKHCSYI